MPPILGSRTAHTALHKLTSLLPQTHNHGNGQQSGTQGHVNLKTGDEIINNSNYEHTRKQVLMNHEIRFIVILEHDLYSIIVCRGFLCLQLTFYYKVKMVKVMSHSVPLQPWFGMCMFIMVSLDVRTIFYIQTVLYKNLWMSIVSRGRGFSFGLVC